MKALFIGVALLWSVANAQETMHLHTDKQLYLPGETIWFKAYLFSNNKPSLSTNLYAGLYDANGNLLSEKQFPVIGGTTNGDFKINDSISSEVVQLYLFTRSMHRDSTALKHIIKLFAGRNKLVRETSVSQLIAVPEGGNLVAGLVNKLIIRAVNPAGSISGALHAAGSGQFIDSFYINKEGLTELQFIPNESNSYFISWSDGILLNQEILLPQPLATGAILQADIVGNTLHYSLQKNNNTDRFKKLHLNIYSGEELLYRESVTMLRNNNFIGNFKTDSFPAGLLYAKLTDDKNNLLQQKKLLMNIQDISVNVIEKNLTPKGRNVVEILVKDTAIHDLSISITDAGFQSANSSSVYELLTPGTRLTDNQLDNRKNFNLVLNSTGLNKPLKFKPEDDNYLRLNITTKERKYAVPENSTLDLIINDKGFGKQFHNLNPSSQSGYMKQGLIFYDSAKVYYKIDDNKGLGEWLVAYVDNIIPLPVKIQAVTLEEPGTNKPYFNDTIVTDYAVKHTKFNEVQVLKTVVVKGKPANPITRRLQEIDEKYSTGTFRGISRGYQLNALDDPDAERSIDIFSYITYRIPGIQTAGSLGSRYIRNNSFRDGEPVLFINETESPRESLETVSPSQLAYVKFIPGIVVGSSGYTANGALYVYTKRGDEPGAITNMKSAFVKGYDMSREFQIPDHSGVNNSNNTDYRSTLYWNPYIFTDKNNRKIQITYYNNDLAKKHILSLKGFTAEGKLVEIKNLIE